MHGRRNYFYSISLRGNLWAQNMKTHQICEATLSPVWDCRCQNMKTHKIMVVYNNKILWNPLSILYRSIFILYDYLRVIYIFHIICVGRKSTPHKCIYQFQIIKLTPKRHMSNLREANKFHIFKYINSHNWILSRHKFMKKIFS